MLYKREKERLRQIRLILKRADDKIESLPFGADQMGILREALAEIAKYTGPMIQPTGRRERMQKRN